LAAFALVAISDEPLLGQTSTKAPEDPPRLVTGRLELQWIDEHDPETGDQELRRRALEAALLYFPGDTQTVFRAEARLAVIDWNSRRLEAAQDRLDRLIQNGADGIDPDIYAWAEILDARVLRELRRIPESLAIFERVAGNDRLSAARRAMAASDAARLIVARSPDETLTLLRTIAALPGGATADVNDEIIHTLLVAGREDELKSELSSLAEPGNGDAGDDQFTRLFKAANAWNLPGDEKRMVHLADLIAVIRPAPGKSLDDAASQLRLVAACRLIHNRILELIAAPPLSAVYEAAAKGSPSTLPGFQRAIDHASRQGDSRRCLRLNLQSLVAFGSDASFPRRLWQAASSAVWAERTLGREFDGRVCDVLLDLCDQLPTGQDFWLEGKFLQAERRAREGDRSGEQALLSVVISVSELRAAYLAPACKRLGASLEAENEDQKALETYQLAESTAATYASGADCVFRAALINLRLGNDEEAKRLIGILQKSPVAVIRDSSSPEQIGELTALVRTGHATECWEAGRIWWPVWQKIESGLVGMPGSFEERIPEIHNLARLLDEIRNAADARDEKAYFRNYAVLMSAARWQPSIGPEVAAISAPAFHFAPDRINELRGLLINVLEAPHPPEIPNFRKRRLFLASNYLNARLPEQALVVAADFNTGGSPNDDFGPAMHQIRGLAAIGAGRDYAAAAADLESDLSDSRTGVQRAMTVGILSDLYHRLGRDQDARQLLSHELENPSIVADGAGHADLAARYARLTGPAEASASPSGNAKVGGTNNANNPSDAASASHAAEWISSLSFAWLDYVEPQKLDDSSLKDLDTELRDPGRIYPPAGQIKFLLLAARDPRFSPGERQLALTEAAVRLVLSDPSYQRMAAIAHSAIDSPAFDDESRMRILWTVLAALSEDGRQTDYNALRKNPICEHFSPDLQRQLALLDLEAGLDRKSPEAIVELATTLGAQELTWAGVQTMNDLFGYLLRRGEIEKADSLAAGSSSWKLSADAAFRVDAVRLDFSRQLRIARAINPVHEAMSASLLHNFPGAPVSLPPEYADARVAGRIPPRRREAVFQACLYLAESRQFDRADLSFWGTVFGAFPRGQEASAATSELLRAGLAAAADDGVRSELIVRFFSAADIDDPTVRQAAERVFADYRKPSDFPSSYLVIRLYEIHRSLRLGEPVALQTAYDDLSDPRVSSVRERDSLRYYTQLGDQGSLRRAIEGIDSGTLLSPGFVAQAIPAFASLGMDAELGTAREAARRILREDVSESWVLGDASDADAALDLALVLHDPAALPPAWVAELERNSDNPMLQERVLLVDAYLHSDWTSVESAAAAINRDFPTRYSFYWFRGLALHHLGRDAAAAEALATYVRYAKDELEYPQALALLNTIGVAGPSEAVLNR
jgi:hypothetical protein